MGCERRPVGAVPKAGERLLTMPGAGRMSNPGPAKVKISISPSQNVGMA